jgi:hypothetical protein
LFLLQKRPLRRSFLFIVYGPYETLVNDFTFSDYHKFGSEPRILAGFEEAPDADGSGSKGSKPATEPR